MISRTEHAIVMPTPLGTIQAIAFICAALAVGGISPVALVGVLAIVALDGMRSSRCALRGLMLIYLVRALNPAFFGESPNITLPAIAAILCCSARIYFDWLRLRQPVPDSVRTLLWLVLAIALTSIASSRFVTVSLFKLFMFSAVAVSIVVAHHHSGQHRAWLLQWLVNCYFAVLILSLPLVAHEFGYFRDGAGFQGILNHPQEYAIFMAPFAALLLTQAINTRFRNSLVWLLFGLVVVTLALTRSRTSVLALLVGVVAGLVIVRAKRLEPAALVRVLLGMSVTVAVLVLSVALNPAGVSGAVQSFLLKEGGADIGEAFETSRGLFILESVDNFLENPVSGIGFGVNMSELRPSVPVYEPLTGLPLSFPTEKGNVVIAVLEETGLVGFAFFAMFLWVYLKGVRTNGDVALASVAMCTFLTNIGETTFFSMNSYGLMSWILMGIALPAVGARLPVPEQLGLAPDAREGSEGS